jgi:hypothetical protein
MDWLRRMWKSAWRTRPPEQWHQGAYRRPTCGHELPATRPGPPSPLGPRWLPPTRAELIAKCPLHGHSPYNDLSKEMADRGELAEGDGLERPWPS